jgi:hypothetical protein
MIRDEPSDAVREAGQLALLRFARADHVTRWERREARHEK